MARGKASAELRRWGLLLTAAAALGGCALTDRSVDPDTGAVTTRHFGYTVVTAPPPGASGAGVEAREVETIGVRIADGVALGYARERRLAVPGDCRLVFLIRDPAQMAWATARAAELQERGELCVALEP